MDGNLGLPVSWDFLLFVSTVASATGFGYFFFKDRDNRKLMFMLAYSFGSLSYLVMMQTGWESAEVLGNLFFWSPFPVILAVFIAVLFNFLRLRDFDKLVQVFLCILAASLLVVGTPLPMKILSPLLFQSMSIVVITVSVYLVLSRRENPDVMFLLSVVCFASAGVTWTSGLSLELYYFAHVFAHIFIGLVFVTSRQGIEGGTLSIFSLRTELTKTRRELRISQERLVKAEKLAAIGEVALMIGHDLRNPLQTLVNNLFLAHEKLQTSPKELSKIFEIMDERLKYMDKIVSDLQDYARPLKLEFAETNIRELIRNTLSAISVPETVKTSIEIKEALDFPDLWVDAQLMKRVFTNLITNALQAMPDGGRLTIRASNTGEAATIQFQDTGVGIPEENLANLFQPLFTTKAQGQGLGLAVCKRLVKAHGGNIMVESELGKGAIFTVEIPYGASRQDFLTITNP